MERGLILCDVASMSPIERTRPLLLEQLGKYAPNCFEGGENYCALHSSSPLHKHASPLFIPPLFFFFFGWSGHLLGISRQLQSFWLLISTNLIIWTTQWARSIVSLEHHAVARIINPCSHFSVQVPGEKEKKGQPINYHNHVNRLGGLLHVQVSCGVGSATHGYTGWRLSTVSQIRLYVNNGNGKG